MKKWVKIKEYIKKENGLQKIGRNRKNSSFFTNKIPEVFRVIRFRFFYIKMYITIRNTKSLEREETHKQGE